MKTIIMLFMFLLSIQSAMAFIYDESWKNSLGEKGPSCALYRQRVANYLQRLSEVDIAERAISGKLTLAEINRMVQLWQRTGVPLLNDESITYRASVGIGPIAETIAKMPGLVSVKVESPVFNWEAPRFIFPEEIFKASVDPVLGMMTFELTMSYPMACLQSYVMGVTFQINMVGGNGAKSGFYTGIDMSKWDYRAYFH